MIEKKPLVTIVMPCLNEEAYVGKALRSLLDDWAIRNCEVLVVDGGSTDRTKQVVEGLIRNPPETASPSQNPPYPPVAKGESSNASGAEASDAAAGVGASGGGVGASGGGVGASAQSRPEDEVVYFFQGKDRWVREVPGEWNPVTAGKRRAVIRLLDNRDRTASCGMNLGIAQAAGKIIVRADAHCLFPPGYVRRCVELLADTGAANAGGVMVPRGEGGETQAAIVLAMRHPLGTGGAVYRKTEFKGEAEGVIFGTFRKALFDEIGGYDIKARANEDSELNVRILCAGKKIYLDSDIKITYFPRKTLGELASQYFRYGRGRTRTTIRHGMLTGWRQVAAPMLLLVTVYAVARAIMGQPAHLLVPTAYALGLVAAAVLTLDRGEGARTRMRKMERAKARTSAPSGASARTGEGVYASDGDEGPIPFATRLTVAAAWGVMHMCWGAGFLFGLVKWW